MLELKRLKDVLGQKIVLMANYNLSVGCVGPL